MDEVELLREAGAVPQPADEVFDRAYQVLLEVMFQDTLDVGAAAGAPLLPKAERRDAHLALRRGWAAQGRRTSIGVGIGIAIFGLALALFLAFVLQPSPSKAVPEATFGFQVTSYSAKLSTAPAPHLLNNALSFGYLPPGFHLLSDGQANKVTTPYRFVQSVIFGTNDKRLGTKNNPQDAFTISVVQAASFDHPLSPANPFPGVTVMTETTVRGHLAQLVMQKGTANTAPEVVLQWIEAPGFAIYIGGVSGPTIAMIEAVADHLTFRPGVHNCVDGDKVVASKSCAAGTVSSPPASVPAGNTVLAGGSVKGNPWILSGSAQGGQIAVALNYQGAVQTQSSVPDSSSAYVLDLSTGLDGERFLIGSAPDLVTEVMVISRGGTTVQAATLRHRLGNHSAFVLSLGQFHGVCDDLCQGRVSVSFFHDNHPLGSTTMDHDEGQAGTVY